MKSLAELLAPLPLPAPAADPGEPGPLAGCDGELVQVLAAGLPAGHLHVWGGPSGAGKTSFLLCLLHGAAAGGRRAAYATYDLPAETLAVRLLGMACGSAPSRLLDGTLDPASAARATSARAALSRLPLWFLEARGLGVASIEDRLVRMPHRPEVLAVDFLQAVVRVPGSELGESLRDLTALASRLHVAVVCALRAETGVSAGPLDEALRGATASADRVGWIAPASGPCSRRAEVLRNRYGDRPALPLRFDPATGGLRAEGA